MGWNHKPRLMGRRVAKTTILACAAAGLMAVAGGGNSVDARAAGAAPAAIQSLAGPAGSMRATISMRQQQFRRDGRAARPAAAPLNIRIERRQTVGKWQSTFTLLATEPISVETRSGLVPLTNPFAASRVEIDEDTGETRVFDRHGRRQAVPGRDDARAFGLSQTERDRALDTRLWADVMRGSSAGRGGGAPRFLAERGQRAARQRELLRQFGAVAGRVRGLDRFVSRDGGHTQEVLVAPDSALPVEVNVVSGGALAEHTELAYTAHTTGDLRHWLRHERAVPGSAGERLVTEVVFSNVALAAGGAE